MSLNYAEIRRLLAVNHPMILVDRVCALTPGQSVEAMKAVSGSEPCYGGLPEDLPIERLAYPTSLLVESFAQAAALMWLTALRPAGDDPTLLVPGAIRDCVVMGAVFPGDVVRHVARIDQSLQGTAFVSGASYVGGRAVLTVGAFVGVERPRESLTGRAG